MVAVAPEETVAKPKADLIDYVDIKNPDFGSCLLDIVNEASELGASDLLIEYRRGGTGEVVTQVRIDGTMRRFYRVPASYATQVINSFKTSANLKSSANLLPESSTLKMQVPSGMKDEKGKETTIERKARIQLFTTSDSGSTIVLRLPPRGSLRSIHELGFTNNNKKRLLQLLDTAKKMLIFVGPMGVGKSTTGYAGLQYLHDGTRTIWSLEDPVERDIEGIIQLEANEEMGTGYEHMLPALVRSDYDTLFLGELRNKITARAAVRQSRAGRQVISTLHANDNVSALIRLIELAEDTPYSVLDSVQGLVSQRLVAKLNPEWDGESDFNKYKGRVPIHEIMVITPDIVDALVNQDSLEAIREIATKHQPETFWHNVDQLIAEGTTDLDEAVRVLGKRPESVGAPTLEADSE
ncbi:GspE/PulE family protein [Glutamicibacter ardleyensis]|uniref:GspE/PulE family protein n=1 Tax=Glutamicibacter ardleyensis TaxID=225894 RepID=UPI003FD208B5